MKKPIRSSKDYWFAGIAGGVAERYNLNSGLIRLILFVIIVFDILSLSSFIIVAYLLIWMFLD